MKSVNWKNTVEYVYTKSLEVKVYLKREVGLEVNPRSVKDPNNIENARDFLTTNFGFDILDMRCIGQIGHTTYGFELFVRADQ